MTMLNYNPILAADSYKLCHQFAYPKNVTGMYSYIEARSTGHEIIVPFGLQMFIEKYLTKQITMSNVSEAYNFAKMHGEPFDAEPWFYIIDQYQGYFPVTIRAVPEGTPVPAGNVIVTIECDDPKVFWLSSYLETVIQRGVWYPTTVASRDLNIMMDFLHFYNHTGADKKLIPFALHDFGARGVTCSEQAEIGGAAHLVNFLGSDNMEGIRAANFYYSEPMAGFSVPATEHSVECSFGREPEEELAYLNHMLDNLGSRGGVVSIVIDGYDVYRAAETLCTTMKDKIIESGCKVVFRPDSGDMQVTVPRILEMQARHFGYDINDAGFKKVRHVGIIQGDGVDSLAIVSLLGKLAANGYASDNVIFGSGGALLQKVNRDTYKMAQKASAIKRDGEWVGISKDPITDHGKRSKEGRVTLVKSKLTGEFLTVSGMTPLSDEFQDAMQTVYHNGEVMNKSTMQEIRARVGHWSKADL